MAWIYWEILNTSIEELSMEVLARDENYPALLFEIIRFFLIIS